MKTSKTLSTASADLRIKLLIYAPGSGTTSGSTFLKIKWRILLEQGNKGKTHSFFALVLRI